MTAITNETIIWIFIQIAIILLFLKNRKTQQYYITFIGCTLLFITSIMGVIVLDNTTGTNQLLALISTATIIIYTLKIAIEILEEKKLKKLEA